MGYCWSLLARVGSRIEQRVRVHTTYGRIGRVSPVVLGVDRNNPIYSLYYAVTLTFDDTATFAQRSQTHVLFLPEGLLQHLCNRNTNPDKP